MRFDIAPLSLANLEPTFVEENTQQRKALRPNVLGVCKGCNGKAHCVPLTNGMCNIA